MPGPPCSISRCIHSECFTVRVDVHFTLGRNPPELRSSVRKLLEWLSASVLVRITIGDFSMLWLCRTFRTPFSAVSTLSFATTGSFSQRVLRSTRSSVHHSVCKFSGVLHRLIFFFKFQRRFVQCQPRKQSLQKVVKCCSDFVLEFLTQVLECLGEYYHNSIFERKMI